MTFNQTTKMILFKKSRNTEKKLEEILNNQSVAPPRNERNPTQKTLIPKMKTMMKMMKMLILLQRNEKPQKRKPSLHQNPRRKL
jgi:hypothetical protein